MDTDPNPFRNSPDSNRSDSPTEAPSTDTQDFTSDASDTDEANQTDTAPTNVSYPINDVYEDEGDGDGVADPRMTDTPIA